MDEFTAGFAAKGVDIQRISGVEVARIVPGIRPGLERGGL